MKRSYIEVGFKEGDNDDPLKLFASLLKSKYGGTEETEEHNRKLLESLIQKGHIAKSNIIWHRDKITKIYGFKVDSSGKIEYDISGSHSPEKKKTYVTSTNKVDMSAVKNAIYRSRHAAI
jgi:hypothetical protein